MLKKNFKILQSQAVGMQAFAFAPRSHLVKLSLPDIWLDLPHNLIWWDSTWANHRLPEPEHRTLPVDYGQDRPETTTTAVCKLRAHLNVPSTSPFCERHL